MARFNITPFHPGDISHDVIHLVAAAENFDGYRSLSDQSWLELSHEGARSATGHLASDSVGGYLARGAGNDRLYGYAHISESNEGAATGTAMEIVISPEQRSDYLGIASALAREAVAGLPATAYPVSLWVTHSNKSLEDVAHTMGMAVGRELHQMRRVLPLAIAPERGITPPDLKYADLNEPTGGDGMPGGNGAVNSPDAEHLDRSTQPDTLALRSFRPGNDELPWLELNNRAFVSHPEQGGWSLDTLAAREEESWFDPQGFIVCEALDRLAGSCWTKIHPGIDHSNPPIGEIYVICVDPAYQGKGLAAPILQAGLDYLSSRGLRLAMLYVESDNTPALQLYRRFGFEIHHTDKAFTLREYNSHHGERMAFFGKRVAQ
ncbi:MAG: mycothiol synthase [Acidimicrobiales bacterium]